jgi:phosphatidylglycerophosphate synthase
MTKTAILFIDTKRVLDSVTAVAVPVTDVPLVKRILIDLRRSGIENIFAVTDERTDEIEAIFDDTRRTSFKRHVFGEQAWRDEITKTGDTDALVLTADRLSDHRFLEKLAEVRSPGMALISVDLKQPDEVRLPEKRFTLNDGKVVGSSVVDDSPAAREVGVYRLPVAIISEFESLDPEYIAKAAGGFKQDGKAAYFDIGNGFVEVIDSKQAVRRAEQRLVRYIWKSTDGMHGRFNKRLILPLLKVLLRTSVTPNMISLLGVIVSIFSGYFYFRGQYKLAVLGGLLAVASSLLDHIDGSIARMKSKESAFGAHFDTICDYVFYVSFGIGATAGLYKGSGSPAYIWMGVATLFGILISLLITSYGRTNFATNASTYATEALKKIDANSQNQIVWLGRRVYFIARRPALPYYILLMTVLGMLPFVLFMMALGTNLFWMYHVYTNKLFSPQPKNLN